MAILLDKFKSKNTFSNSKAQAENRGEKSSPESALQGGVQT